MIKWKKVSSTKLSPNFMATKKAIEVLSHTVGPAMKDVPESIIAAQPPAQKPEISNFGILEFSEEYNFLLVILK